MAEVVRALQRARGRPDAQTWGGLVLLVGAGCSFSAGIPLGGDIVRESVTKLARAYSNETFDPATPDAAFQWLKDNRHLASSLEWADAYGELFQTHFSDPVIQQRIVREAIQRARGINWAHVCIGELVRCRYVHTVLTTNFDQLALDGIIRAGLLPVVADGVEALSRIEGRPSNPQLVHLHGTAHTYRPRNSRSDVGETSGMVGVVGVLRDVLLKNEALIVIGYAGGEEGVMHVLLEAAKEAGEKTIFWIQYEDNPEKLSDRAQRLLGFSRSGGLVVGQDADSFFAEVARELGIGVPHWMRAPVEALVHRANSLVGGRDALVASQVTTYQRVLADLGECLKGRDRRAGPVGDIDRAEKLTLAGRAAEAQSLLDARPLADVPPELLESLADAAVTAGRQAADVSGVERAVEGYRRVLDVLAPAALAARVRVRTKLGDALMLLGQRTAKADLLEAAVSELRQAADQASRDVTPTEFGDAHRALGSGLTRLAHRRSGLDLLNGALAAYDRALEIYTRDARPLEWAKVQNNIGNALQKIAERSDDSGKIRDAVAAYRRALEVFTRETLPEAWAATLNNMANALQRLAWAEEDDVPLEEAIAAYRQTLEVYTLTAFPLDYAMTQTNLGSALETVGRRQRRSDAVADALAAYHAALEVYKRDDFEVDWARTQGNIGNALRSLARIERKAALLDDAKAAHEQALQIYAKGNLASDLASSQHDLGMTLVVLAELTGATDGLAEALEVLRKAQALNTREAVPVRWASAQRYVAEALLMSGEQLRDASILKQALAEATKALDPPISGLAKEDASALQAIRERANRALEKLDSA